MKRPIIVIVLIMAFIAAIAYSAHRANKVENTVTYSSLMNQIRVGNVEKIKINEMSHTASVIFKNHTIATVAIPSSTNGLLEALQKTEAIVEVESEKGSTGLTTFLLTFGPVLLLVFFWWLFLRSQTRQGPGALSAASKFQNSAQEVSAKENNVRLADVAGCDEAKLEVAEIVDFLKDSNHFKELGGRSPRGVLMMGQPGTGKTLLAKAIAGEAGVTFFYASGSDFVEMFVGVGASRIRKLFEQAKKKTPSIIFIDEIDAVGRKRGSGHGGGNDEREQTLNQLLVEMDGFNENENVIIIATTNRPDILDEALRRPGRFDREVHVSLPDIKGRVQILEVHAKKIKISKEVDFHEIARGTPGFSGADLANLVNEAAITATRNKHTEVLNTDFSHARDKIIMGFERKSLIMPEKERRNTAFHEAGHAVMAYVLPNADPLHKVTIVPRGRALGLTMQLPLEDRYGYGREELLTQIKVLLGGRIAEEIFLSTMTTGASNDIERATDLARKMVTEWGMSPLGPIHYGESSMWEGGGKGAMISDDTKRKVSEEIETFIREQYTQAKEILLKHRTITEKLALALLDKETLEIQEIQLILGDQTVAAA